MSGLAPSRQGSPAVMINALLLPVALVIVASATASVCAGEVGFPPTETYRIDTARTAKTVLSRTDIARARVWGLSETEWRRYQSLMQGIRDIWGQSKNTI